MPYENLAARKLYIKENPERVIFWNAKSSARKKSIEFSIELSDIVIPKICPCLGIPIVTESIDKKATPNSPSIDRIDPSKGYVKGNVRVISWRANKIKSDASIEELEMIASYMRSSLTNV